MNKYYRSGIFSLVALGAFYLWRNRFEVQEFLESKGISTPLDTSGKLTDTIKSGIAKVTGKSEYAADKMISSVSKAV